MKDTTTKATPLGARIWISIILFGLFGQLAWVLENMYFNVFMDRTVTSNPFAVQLMVALSAIVATFSTLMTGTLTDRLGKRKQFISWGYIVWGATVMLFALISVKNTATLFGIAETKAVTATVAIIVIMDCVMTFVGSFCNDAAFNAWVTDVTDKTNRGFAEGVLAIMPIMAMALVFGGLDSLTWDTFRMPNGTIVNTYQQGATLVSHGQWWLFFVIIGGITALAGFAGLFLVKESPTLKPNKNSNFKNIFYGLKLSVIKENKDLYYTYAAMAVVGIANMSYLPYIIQYVERTLKYTNYIIPVGIIIVVSAVVSVILGVWYDKLGRNKFIIPISALFFAGAVAMTVISPLVFKDTVPMWMLAIAGVALMSGNLGLGAIFTSTVRDLTPTDKVGLFQGVRMVFWVLIPMVIGPLITAIITVGSNPVGKDYYGNNIYEYPPYMFLVAAGTMLLNIPFVLKVKKYLDGANQKVLVR
ncbi:MAG: MFS transporter [Clostridia bacterium]|nr:MFS transporter [Clostridia bacterium]